ncbi:MAG: bleomycin resistance protein [Kordiimonas sp.]|nr:bleomycin resistance protein [Kordiimonas sp.]|tara:strand:+ start:4160 stop:4594 length:435 start_codon:yes stop_codon:yes gene_type:complete
MPDIGFTHIALPATDLDASAAFYQKYAGFHIVHDRVDEDGEHRVIWLSDGRRPFVLVLIQVDYIRHALGPLSHLGVSCHSRADVDAMAKMAKAAGCLREGPYDLGQPVGYIVLLADPDGHTLELSYGQEVRMAVEETDMPPAYD